MIILNNDHKKIMQVSINDTIHETVDEGFKRSMYVPELPRVITTNKKDAELIQKYANDFINKLSHELIKNNKEEEIKYE